MAQEKSLADKLVFFLRMRDEARVKLEALDKDGELWPMLAVMLDEREKAAGDALYEQTMAVDRIGRLAEWAKAKKKA